MGYPDFFTQLFQGNMIAYTTLFEAVGLVVAVIAIMIFWWKLPQLAKSQFINNTWGGAKPTVATCYPDKTVKFRNPILYSNGISYDGSWQILLKADGKAAVNLAENERKTVNEVYRMEGTNSPLFLRWSKQAYMTNPEIATLIQNAEGIEALSKASEKKPIMVKKQAFIDALKKIPKDMIQIAPMYFTFDIDVQKINALVPGALSDTNFKEHENIVREEERGKNARTNLIMAVLVLVGISLLLGVVTLLKVLNVF